MAPTRTPSNVMSHCTDARIESLPSIGVAVNPGVEVGTRNPRTARPPSPPPNSGSSTFAHTTATSASDASPIQRFAPSMTQPSPSRRAVVVMPLTTPRLKFEAVRALGGEVILHGESYSDAYLHARELQERHGYTFVHPFDDPDVIAGQGTVGMEILRQHPRPIHAVFVAVGGGGLVSGVAAYIKAVRPEIKVVGVQMADSDAMIRSVRAGERATQAP